VYLSPPSKRDGAKVVQAFCSGCGVMFAFNSNTEVKFPDQGILKHCMLCQESTQWFRIWNARVVNHPEKINAHVPKDK